MIIPAVTTASGARGSAAGSQILVELPHADLDSFDASQIGPYTLIDELAVGGMAEVHLAKTRGLAGFEKHVALKIIHDHLAGDDSFVQMLVDEAKLVVQLSHANIAQILDLGCVDDRYYIAMEYVDGLDLDRLTRALGERDKPFPIDCAVYIARETCAALDSAYNGSGHDGAPLRIIHRDISPQNMMVSRRGEVKLIDFGIAKASHSRRVTQPGFVKGKFLYMSPEQLEEGMLDHRSDIYSVGLVLHEMLTGRMRSAPDVRALADLVNRNNVPSMRVLRDDVPPELDAIVMRAVERDPEQRWQSAHDLQVALTSFLSSYSGDFTPARLAALVALNVEPRSTNVVAPRVTEEPQGGHQVVPVVVLDEPHQRAKPTAEQFARTTMLAPRDVEEWVARGGKTPVPSRAESRSPARALAESSALEPRGGPRADQVPSNQVPPTEGRRDDVWTIHLDPKYFIDGGPPQMEPIAFSPEAPPPSAIRRTLVVVALVLCGVVLGAGAVQFVRPWFASRQQVSTTTELSTSKRPIRVAGAP